MALLPIPHLNRREKLLNNTCNVNAMTSALANRKESYRSKSARSIKAELLAKAFTNILSERCQSEENNSVSGWEQQNRRSIAGTSSAAAIAINSQAIRSGSSSVRFRSMLRNESSSIERDITEVSFKPLTDLSTDLRGLGTKATCYFKNQRYVSFFYPLMNPSLCASRIRNNRTPSFIAKRFFT